MIEALTPLVESGLLSPETESAITEAWNTKLKDMQSQIRTEIREEFAGRYEHDKEVMVKTLEKMVTESLTTEILQIKEHRNQVAKLQLASKKQIKESAAKFKNFMVRALAEELAEFAKERKLQEAHKAKLEQFVMSSLAEEINEFAQDKKALTEARVKLVAEGKEEISKLKAKFVKRSGAAVAKIVSETLNHEITQLREDINLARKNQMGRKIFESFAAEFAANYFNESAEAKKFQKQIAQLTNQLEESKKALSEKQTVIESKNKEAKKLAERAERANLMASLLESLDAPKKAVMRNLLESVQTNQLRSQFNKLLPSVLSRKAVTSTHSVLSESTGNKNISSDSLSDDIVRLAGITKGAK